MTPQRLRQLVGLFAGQPRRWLVLLAWPAAVLALVLVGRLCFPGRSAALVAVEALLVLSALGSLGLFARLATRFYRHLREVRQQLFQGKYEAAVALTRRYPALAFGLGLEAALERLFQFDSRRAEKVAAATRLFDSLLRETPLPILLGDLDANTVRFSRALCRLFEIPDDRFPLDALLTPAANRRFAHLWSLLADARRATATTTVNIQLPVPHTPQRLDMRLLAVQNDQGRIVYILGIAQPPQPANEAEARTQQAAQDNTPGACP